MKAGRDAIKTGSYTKTADGKIVNKEGKEIAPAPAPSSLLIEEGSGRGAKRRKINAASSLVKDDDEADIEWDV